MNARLYRILACPTCGRHYGRTLDEALAMVCCGKPLPTVPIDVKQGTPVYHPNADQLVTAPPELTKTPPPEIRS